MAAPYEDEAISFSAGVGNFGDYWVSVAARRLDTATTTRGRQYELDTVQTGEYHPTYDNRDGALTPGNTASPFYPNVVPLRPVRKRMQYPATQNMLTPNQASSGEAVAVTTIDGPVTPGNTVSRVYGAYQNPIVTTSASAFEGGQVLQTAVPASPATGAALIFMTGITIVSGQAHTYSVYVRTPAGANALQARAAFTWWDASGNFISQSLGTVTSLPTASLTWTRVTVTATPPSNAAGAWVGVAGGNSPATACTLQCDAAQLEYAAAATTYTKPSTWYYLFNGYIERWPQRWDANGLFHKTEPVAVDHFGYLSQTILKPPSYMDMLATNASFPLRFFYTFDVGQVANHVTDLSHNRGPAPVTSGWYGAGSLTFGNSITSSFAPNSDSPSGGGFLGGAGAVATFNNPIDPAGNNLYLAGTYIDLTQASGYAPPVGDGSGWYTRIIGFRCPAVKAWEQAIWNWENPGYTYTSALTFDINHSTGAMSLSGIANFGTSPVTDGNWHFAAVRINPSTGAVATFMDYFEQATGSTSPSNTTTVAGNSDVIGTDVTNGSQYVRNGFTGDVAFVAEFGGYLSTSTLQDLYVSWRSAWVTDNSAVRYNRVLGWMGFFGSTNVTTTPATASMGPATDITAGGQQASVYAPVTGTDVQTALQNIVTTENGSHFVAGDGTLTFQSRSARYSAAVPTIVFGENQAGGEIPYEDLQFDFDVTRIANDVQVTQYVNSSVYEAFAPTSQAAYGTRTLTRTINSFDVNECNDAANYLAYRYSNPDLRLKTLRIHVTANPTKWGTLLALECGTKVRTMRRSLEQTITWDGFVEKISWSLDYKSNDVFLDLELSPADLSAFWELAAVHTTLASSYSPAALNSNTGFETGLSPWTASGTSSFTQSSTQVHSGSFSAKLVPNGTTANVGPMSEQVAVTANGAVQASCWVWFTNTVSGAFSASVNWFNSSHTYLTTSSTFVSVAAATWTNVSNVFQAPAGAVYASFVPVLTGTPPSSQVWYLDDAALTSATIVLNPLPSASTLPVGAYLPNNGAGTGTTVQCGSYTTGVATVPAFKLRLGAGTGTYEEIAVTSYTSTGGTQVQNYAGRNVPGQFTGYTSVTMTLASAPVNSYSSGATVSEALPSSMTDPTAHDVDAVLGTTTIIGY